MLKNAGPELNLESDRICFLILLYVAVKCIVPKKTRAYSHHKDPPFDIKHQQMSADPFPVVKLTLRKRVGF